MALVKPLCALLCLATLCAAQNPHTYATLAYGNFYNYEQESSKQLKGSLGRVDIVHRHNNFWFEGDGQWIHAGANQNSPFFLGEAAYRVLDVHWLPEFWISASYIALQPFSPGNSATDLHLHDVGAGFTASFQTAYLTEGMGNFSLRYYPRERVLYKSMQVGWDIGSHWGLSFGGLGIRVPAGRYYSAFVFALRLHF